MCASKVLLVVALFVCVSYGKLHAKAPVCPEDQDKDLYFLDDEDCGLFHVCFMGTLTSQKCPEGLIFNTEKTMCDWPSPSVCSPRCPGNELLVHPHEQDCTKFSVCRNRKETVHTCLKNMEYSSKYKQCVPITDSGCTAGQN